VSSEKEGLIHKEGKISYSWNTVAVKPKYCDFFQELVKESPVKTLTSTSVSILRLISIYTFPFGRLLLTFMRTISHLFLYFKLACTGLI
jgi:hypothetical protein